MKWRMTHLIPFFLIALCIYLLCEVMGNAFHPANASSVRAEAEFLPMASMARLNPVPETSPVPEPAPAPIASQPEPVSAPITVQTPAPVAPDAVEQDIPEPEIKVPERPAVDPMLHVPAGYRKVKALVTGYCPCSRCCGRGSFGITSTGANAWTTGAAADPRAIPYGQKIYIPKYGWTTVDDTGGAMRQNWRKGRLHFDIRYRFHWEARQWGARWMDVLIEE